MRAPPIASGRARRWTWNFAPHRLQRSRCDLGDEGQDVRAAEGRKAGAGGVAVALGEPGVDGGRLTQQDEAGVEVGLVERIIVHVGRKIARRRDEARDAFSCTVVQKLLPLARVEPVLDVEPVGPVRHEVDFRRVRDHLLRDGLLPVLNEDRRLVTGVRGPLCERRVCELRGNVVGFLSRLSLRLAAGLGGARERFGRCAAIGTFAAYAVAAHQELRQVGSDLRAPRRSAEDRLLAEWFAEGARLPPCRLALVQRAAFALRGPIEPGQRLQHAHRIADLVALGPLVGSAGAEVGEGRVAKERHRVDLGHLGDELVGAEDGSGRDRERPGVRPLEVEGVARER